MNRTDKIKKIAGVGIMMALTIVLQIISSYIKFGTAEIALGLIPMILGACIYGPVAGLLLGLTEGLVIMLSPATLAAFMPVNPAATIILCLLKTGVAGLMSGFMYRWLKKVHSIVRTGISALISPIINTGLFICGTLLFFLEVYGGATYLFTFNLLINFLIELGVMIVLVPIFERLLKLFGKELLPAEDEEVEENTEIIENQQEEKEEQPVEE